MSCMHSASNKSMHRSWQSSSRPILDKSEPILHKTPPRAGLPIPVGARNQSRSTSYRIRRQVSVSTPPGVWIADRHPRLRAAAQAPDHKRCKCHHHRLLKQSRRTRGIATSQSQYRNQETEIREHYHDEIPDRESEREVRDRA